jgi:microcompartment protein CcmL/EutN
MTENALGLIETVGLPTAIEAADAAMKAARVRLVGYEKTRGGGLVVVKIRGDVGAVRAAVEAAVVSASKVGKIYGYHVIPRPHEETEQVIDLVDRGPAAAPQPPILGETAPAKAPKAAPPKAPEPAQRRPAPSAGPKRVAKAPAPAPETPPAQSPGGEEPPAEPRDVGGAETAA